MEWWQLPPYFYGSPPTWPQQGGMSAGTTSDGRAVGVPRPGEPQTQMLATIPWGPGYTNIPTIYNGKQIEVPEAAAVWRRHLGIDPETGIGGQSFPTIDDAVSSAKRRSRERVPELAARLPWVMYERHQ